MGIPIVNEGVLLGQGPDLEENLWFSMKKIIFGISNTYVDAKFCLEFIPGDCGAIRNRPDLEKTEKSSKIIQILPFWK